MGNLKNYSFVSVAEQTRPLGLRLMKTCEDIKEKHYPYFVELRIEPPNHTNGDWKIEISFGKGVYRAAYVKGVDLRAATDKELFDFIYGEIESYEKEQKQPTVT